jgi:hypothetical protein
MSIQNPICRSVYASAVGSRFGVGFGVSTLCRNLRRRSRRELCHRERQNRPSGRPVAGAHRSMTGARADALLLSNDAGCLRALANVSASFHCNSPVLWPTTHCGRSWVPRWPARDPRRGQRRKLSCERSSSAFPKMPAARTAPDRLSRAWERSFSCRSSGLAPASLANASVSARALPSPCAALGRLIAFSGPLGACANFAQIRESSCCISLRLLGQSTLCYTARAASARPKTRRVLLQTVDLHGLWSQTFFNQHSNLIKEQISHHASY